MIARGPTLLLVDDDADLRDLIALHLVRSGWRVYPAASGEEAIELACREPPDVILLDCRMCGMDGLTTLRELRARPQTVAVPVVLMTAGLDPCELDAARMAGCAGVIAKPFDGRALATELRRLVPELEG
jgi:CheY-like chemotaxis protein